MSARGLSRAALAPFLLGLAGWASGCSAGDDGNPPGGLGSGGSTASGGEGGSTNVAALCASSKAGLPRLRRLTRDELFASLNAAFPDVQGAWSANMDVDPISDYGFDNDAQLLQVGEQTARKLAALAESVGGAVAGAALPALLPCAAAGDAACARQFGEKYGKRLYRRPLSTAEVDEVLALYTAASTQGGFAKGIDYATRALVQAPQAVYRSEVGVASGKSYQLTQHEVATELAFTFTGQPPSDELLAQADRGELSTVEQISASAQALLATPAAEQPVQKFFDSWLGYRRVTTMTKSALPDFLNLRGEMLAETQRFVRRVVTSGGGLYELLTASYSAPSASLAALYGFPAPDAAGLTERPAGRGVGVLAQGSFLAGFSAVNASSPTQRGLVIHERLLCRPRLEPPDDVPMIPDPAPGVVTTRQRYEQNHAGVTPCSGCHLQFDPIGFGFEHFDELGRYRADEGGLVIDASGQVPGLEPALTFDGQEQLALGLASARLPYECTTGYLQTYVFGAGESCLGEARRTEFIERKIGFVDYIASLAAEPHFRQRSLP